MRARICSVFSCDMFARVVWLRLRRVRDYRFSLSYLPHALATHYFLRLTRARGRRFLRGWKILLNDFCRAFGHSKARERKRFFKHLAGEQCSPPSLADGSRRLPQKAGENFNMRARKHTEIKIPSCNLVMTGFFQIIFLRSACFFLYT